MTGPTRCELSIDGASRGNPGPAGIGIVLKDAKRPLIRRWCQYLGQTTNNVAEYQALVRGLEQAQAAGYEHVAVKTDSQLLARQIAGHYRVRHENLKPLHEQAQVLIARLASFQVEHVPREKNKEADRMANRAVDTRVSVLTEVP
jgi:ribonuclease HI